MNHCKICGNNIPDEVEDCHQAGFGEGCMKTMRTMNQIPNIEEVNTREVEEMDIAMANLITKFQEFLHQQLQKARQDIHTSLVAAVKKGQLQAINNASSAGDKVLVEVLYDQVLTIINSIFKE